MGEQRSHALQETGTQLGTICVDDAAKHWLFNEGQISWDEVFERWKARGPMNEIYVESVRRSHGSMKKMLEASAA